MKNHKKLGLLILAALIGIGSVVPAWSQPGSKPQDLKWTELPKQPQAPAKTQTSSPDILLVMPQAKADMDETMEAISDAHGTVVGRFGDGALTTLIIQSEKGKLDDLEKKLSKDEHIATVQRNFTARAKVAGAAGTPNDPFYPSQWHMAALNVNQTAWALGNGQGAIIAVGDSGCQASNPDLRGKTYSGIDVVNNTNRGTQDIDAESSHGTCVATTAAASTNNNKLTAAPARGARIYPIQLATTEGYTTDLYVARAIYEAGLRGIRIINISYGASDARYSFANPQAHPVVHAMLKWYHDRRNGLAFFAAGNEHQFDPNPRVPYLIMVSAISEEYSLASFSNGGNSIWFTAPGTNIVCSNRDGRATSINGTSFSSPLAASIAAMVISRNPGLRNTKVEQILIASCRNIPGSTWNVLYGFGLPDAEKALRLAR